MNNKTVYENYTQSIKQYMKITQSIKQYMKIKKKRNLVFTFF